MGNWRGKRRQNPQRGHQSLPSERKGGKGKQGVSKKKWLKKRSTLMGQKKTKAHGKLESFQRKRSAEGAFPPARSLGGGHSEERNVVIRNNSSV